MSESSPHRFSLSLLSLAVFFAGFPSTAAARPYRLDKSSTTGWYYWECKNGQAFGWSPDKESAKEAAKPACRSQSIGSAGANVVVGWFTPTAADGPSSDVLPPIGAAGDTSSELSGGDGVTVGVSLPFRGEYALDFGLSTSEDRASRSVVHPETGRRIAQAETDVTRLTADLGVRFYPLAFSDVRLWLYGGVRATSLDPGDGTLTFDGRVSEIPDSELERERTIEATVGLGADVELSNSLGLSLAGRWGPETGWGVTAGVVGLRLFSRERYVYACHSERESGTCCRGFGCSWGNNDITCRSADRHCAGSLELTPIARQ
jgi:hypothetical protein